jgi:hypothetical protein
VTTCSQGPFSEVRVKSSALKLITIWIYQSLVPGTDAMVRVANKTTILSVVMNVIMQNGTMVNAIMANGIMTLTIVTLSLWQMSLFFVPNVMPNFISMLIITLSL